MRFVFHALILVSTIPLLPLSSKAQVSPECTGAIIGALIGVLVNPQADVSGAMDTYCGDNRQPNS